MSIVYNLSHLKLHNNNSEALMLWLSEPNNRPADCDLDKKAKFEN